MSELKGQLLGILLALTLFSILSLALTPIFSNATSAISEKISDELDI